jgi:hypothetical protein
MTLIGILKFDEGIKLEYSDPNWNIWGSKALIGISPYNNYGDNISAKFWEFIWEAPEGNMDCS